MATNLDYQKNSAAFASPSVWKDFENGEHAETGNYGLTKREYFAAKVLQGLASNPDWAKTINNDWDDFVKRISEGAVKIADAIIEELYK